MKVVQQNKLLPLAQTQWTNSI